MERIACIELSFRS